MLTGFSQDAGIRQFAFENVAPRRDKVTYRVRVDTSLSKKYGIRIQELPLFCRKLLDKFASELTVHTLVFPEEEMQLIASDRLRGQNADKRVLRTPRKPLSSIHGMAWRGPRH